MNWSLVAFRCWKSGPYYVTGHAGSPNYYLSYHEQSSLGRFATAEEARSACEAHAREAVR